MYPPANLSYHECAEKIPGLVPVRNAFNDLVFTQWLAVQGDGENNTFPVETEKKASWSSRLYVAPFPPDL